MLGNMNDFQPLGCVVCVVMAGSETFEISVQH